MLAIRLDKKLEERLSSLAKITGRTKTFYAKEAIENYLDDLEDIYLAEKTLNDINAGKVKLVGHEEFWNGLEN